MNDLETIASRAADEGIAFLLTGGHAVIIHGFARSTFDLDLVVRQSDKQKWLQLARGMGYEAYHQGPSFIQFNAAKADSFPLDLMLVNDQTFSKLQAEAILAPPGTPGVQVVSLLHLLALKCHAIKHGHPGRILKDAEDVIQLIQNNKLNPEAEEIRDLFQKHGTAEFYERIKAACRRGS